MANAQSRPRQSPPDRNASQDSKTNLVPGILSSRKLTDQVFVIATRFELAGLPLHLKKTRGGAGVRGKPSAMPSLVLAGVTWCPDGE